MVKPLSRALGAVLGHLRRQLLAGVIIAAPLVVTYLLLHFIFVNLDNLLEPVFSQALGRTIPGLGLIALVVILYALGLLATNIIGRSLIRRSEGILLRLPVFKEIYGPARQTVQAMSQVGQAALRRVVLVEYPRKGIKSMGFATGSFHDRQGQELTIVYFPSTPLPTTGFIVFFPPAEVEDAGIPVDAAIRLFVSGGIVPAKEQPAASVAVPS